MSRPPPRTLARPQLPPSTSAQPLPLGNKSYARLKPLDGDPIDSSRLRTRGVQSSKPFLSAFFVTSNTGETILLDGPPGTLLAHSETLETDANTTLSRVSFETGDPVWSVALGQRAQLHLAKVTGDVVVVVFRVGGDNTVAGFAVSDGAERYRRTLN